MKPIGVIFDMDGVLVDSYVPQMEAWRLETLAYGLEWHARRFYAALGQTGEDIIRTLYPGMPGDQVAVFLKGKEARYRALIAKRFPGMPGASELMRLLAAEKFCLAVASSSPRETVNAVCGQLPALFSAWVGGEEVDKGKPAPDIFHRAAEHLGVPIRSCVVVEDSPAGLIGGRLAGAMTIGLTSNAVTLDLFHCADVLVDSLSEITPAMIRGLVKRKEI